MRISDILRHIAAAAVILPAILLQGCGMVTDEPVDCPASLRVRFIYDYNIKYADAFAREVKSVNVWAFDAEGKPVWSHSESGAVLASGDFVIDTPLPEGRYDFVAWCGLKDNDAFELATYQPQSKEELLTTLRAAGDPEGDSPVVCESYLPALFHGTLLGVDYAPDPFRPSIKTVTIPLMKNTNDIRVMLQHLDGSEIRQKDFSATITTHGGRLGWDNSPLPAAPVTYRPWNVKYGQVTSPAAQTDTREDSQTVTSVASLMFEFSTSRLILDRGATLTVRLDSENRDIIRIPLLDYFILVMGHYPEMSEQEYLDRQDDYSILFFIDGNSDWYRPGGIYINQWAVVPPQDEEII